MSVGPRDAESLESTYALVAEACGLSAIGVDAGTLDRRPRRNVASPDCAIDHMAASMEMRYGARPSQRVAATWALHRSLLITGLLITGPYLLLNRLPDVPAGGIALDLPDGVATVVVNRSSAAPGEPPPGTGTGSDAKDVHIDVRSALVRHIAPLLAAFRPHVRLGERALWGTATDQISGGLRHLGRTAGIEPSAVAAAHALLPGGTPPFAGSAAFSAVTAEDGTETFRRTRLHCCLLVTMSPDDTCATCPRRSRIDPH